MTSNFHFLTPQWQALAEPAAKVEAFANSDPRTACFYARRALELAVDWLFDHDAAFRRPYDRNLAALLAEPSFAANVPGPVALKARVIRDLGNQAVHSKRPVHQLDAVRAAGELFHILYWFARTYSKAWRHEGLAFDPALLPKAAPGAAAAAQQQATAAQVQKLAEELKGRDLQLAAAEQKL